MTDPDPPMAETVMQAARIVTLRNTGSGPVPWRLVDSQTGREIAVQVLHTPAQGPPYFVSVLGCATRAEAIYEMGKLAGAYLASRDARRDALQRQVDAQR